MAEKAINTGGPAFPAPELGAQEFGQPWAYPGMTLRDYFAAKAMQGMVSSIDGESNYQRLRALAAECGLSVSSWIARDAYKQADAMIKAREANNG